MSTCRFGGIDLKHGVLIDQSDCRQLFGKVLIQEIDEIRIGLRNCASSAMPPDADARSPMSPI
jgi:hypothetical protein